MGSCGLLVSAAVVVGVAWAGETTVAVVWGMAVVGAASNAPRVLLAPLDWAATGTLADCREVCISLETAV